MSSPSSVFAPSPTSSPSPPNNNDNRSGPSNSPLLFFVALGFGVVFTNLWIIVGVKYCFRYNARNRALRNGETGEPIDMAALARPHRRRKEKKLMTMEEVNEKFPQIKYKVWKAGREDKGLSSAGGIAATASRPASIKDAAGAIGPSNDIRGSDDTVRDATTLELAQRDHATTSPTKLDKPATSAGATVAEGTSTEPETVHSLEQTKTTTTTIPDNERKGLQPTDTAATAEDEEDEDDPIRTAAAPEMLATPGDTCAICLDTLELDDDVRGLTCGHAFHASCIDPWLTSRRACCPLCKADYYVPKPRADGQAEDSNASSSRGTSRFLYVPPSAMISHRDGGFRPRMILAGNRFVIDPRDRYEMQQQREARRQQRLAENGGRTWRDRIPRPSVPAFFRRNRSDAAATPATPGQLEAGAR